MQAFLPSQWSNYLLLPHSQALAYHATDIVSFKLIENQQA